MFSVYFIHQRFFHQNTSEKEQFNSAFFTLTILLNIVGSVNVLRPKMQAQGDWLHIDNAKLHNAALLLQKIKETEFTRLPHSPYSSDSVPCDFFLFGT
jgi:hypothetical protein